MKRFPLCYVTGSKYLVYISHIAVSEKMSTTKEPTLQSLCSYARFHAVFLDWFTINVNFIVGKLTVIFQELTPAFLASRQAVDGWNSFRPLYKLGISFSLFDNVTYYRDISHHSWHTFWDNMWRYSLKIEEPITDL